MKGVLVKPWSSLVSNEPKNAPQDDKENGIEDKSAEETDVQRTVEQLLIKYTTIFEKERVL